MKEKIKKKILEGMGEMDFEHRHPTLASWLETVLQEEIESGIIIVRQREDDKGKALVINHQQQWAIELECTVSFQYEDYFKSDKELIH